MNDIIIFEDHGFRNLLPLTWWRTVFELRCGYCSLMERMTAHFSESQVTLFCRPEMADVAHERLGHPVNVSPKADSALLINGRLLATGPIAPANQPAVQFHEDTLIALQADTGLLEKLTPELLADTESTRNILQNLSKHEFITDPQLIGYPWDLIHANPAALSADWQKFGQGHPSQGTVYDGAHLLNPNDIHVGPGSKVKPGTVLDAEKGPIYIGSDVTVSPNCSIEGPCYIGDGSLIQPGSVLREATSIGRRCKVGGEVEGSIIHGHANKQHDGFLGHSYVGEWVNLAADTVTSDLKNTYGTIRVPVNGVEVESGQMFVGLTIGDHSKTGIGQMFPTGAVVGFGCNVATGQLAPKYLPSFTWMVGGTLLRYDPQRCLAVARKVMQRRGITLSEAESRLFLNIPVLARDIESQPSH